MKTASEHVLAQKYLRCKQRNFELDHGALIFLRTASTPMIEWLQEVHTNDSEALIGNTDFLMEISTAFTASKIVHSESKIKRRIKKQLYERLRSTDQK